MNQSPIIRFTSGEGTDHQGRRIDQIRAWEDWRLEAVHDYIQWLFPLPEASGFNPYAPVLTPEDIAAVRDDPALQESVRKSFQRLLRFYGFAWQDGAVVQTDASRLRAWVTPGNHNFLRVSRILRSLALLGLRDESAAFLAVLERLAAGEAGRIIGTVSLHHWREAARTA
jgi:hypothetical protein